MNAGQEQIRRCRGTLKDLSDYYHDRLAHWRALPGAIRHAIAYACKVEVDEARAAEEREVAGEISSALGQFAAPAELPYSQTAPLVGVTLRLLSLSQKLARHGEKGSLWHQLHSTVQQHMESAVIRPEDVRARVGRVLDELSSLPDGAGESAAGELSHSLELCLRELTVANLTRLKEQFDEVRNGLPAITSPRPAAPHLLPLHTTRFRLAVIEDNPQWQECVRRAVEAVKEVLGTAYDITTECFDNVADALTALVPKVKEASSVKAEQDGPPVQTIAVTDIGLPADAADVAAIARNETAPDRANGHRLLAQLRSYRANIPTIVLTTPPYLLTDQLDACRQGVEDYDYILKGPDKEDRLVAAILRHVRRAQAHRVELWLSPKYEARIDGVPLPLGEMSFRTFYALCQLSRGSRNSSFRLETILDQLDESFRDEYDYKRPPETAVERALVLGRQRSGRWWRPEWEVPIANVIRLWAARKADAGGNLSRACAMLKREHFQVWKDALHLFDLYRRANPDPAWAGGERQPVESLPPEVLQNGFEKVFGGLELDRRPDYDLHNIEEHISQIRNSAHRAFNDVHRFIEPRHELLVGRPVNDEYGYRVFGEITIHQDFEDLSDEEPDDDEEDYVPPVGRDDRAISVLVVENEPSYSERIRSLLLTASFEVRVATNEADAAALALAYRPDILCLDLHIPATRSEYEEHPYSGDAGGGLRLFDKIREELPDLHVVVPTTLFDRDDLRETASRLGIPVANIVPKGETLNGADWEGHLLLTHSRLRQEIRSRAVLPAPPPWLYPVVAVMPGSDWLSGRLNLTVNGRPFRMQKSKQGLLLGLLLRNHNEVVSYRQIDTCVEGRPVPENARKMWVKNLRDKIRGEWLGLTPDALERPELNILETVGGGLVLHAFVEGLEASDDKSPA